MPKPAELQAMSAAVVAGDAALARRLAWDQVARGNDLLRVVDEGFSAGIRRVGELWEAGDYFLPELVQGAEAMKAAMSEIVPALARQRQRYEPRGRVVLGTVRGDLHDIGKSLVGVLLVAHGYEVHDLGVDVPVEAFVAKARQVGAEIVGVSALLTTTMVAQREIVLALAAAQFERPPRVLVGGAPTSLAWAEEIGAAHADNALRAVAVANSLLS